MGVIPIFICRNCHEMLVSFGDALLTHAPSTGPRRLVTVAEDGLLSVYNAASSKLLLQRARPTHLAVQWTCIALWVDPTGGSAGLLALGTDSGVVVVWDLAEARELHKLESNLDAMRIKQAQWESERVEFRRHTDHLQGEVNKRDQWLKKAKDIITEYQKRTLPLAQPAVALLRLPPRAAAGGARARPDRPRLLRGPQACRSEPAAGLQARTLPHVALGA